MLSGILANGLVLVLTLSIYHGGKKGGNFTGASYCRWTREHSAVFCEVIEGPDKQGVGAQLIFGDPAKKSFVWWLLILLVIPTFGLARE